VEKGKWKEKRKCIYYNAGVYVSVLTHHGQRSQYLHSRGIHRNQNLIPDTVKLFEKRDNRSMETAVQDPFFEWSGIKLLWTTCVGVSAD
jgi:hypothetical protein